MNTSFNLEGFLMGTVDWNSRLSDIALNVKPSPIRALLKYTKTPGVISFAGGNPDPAVFPVSEFAEASQILTREGADVVHLRDSRHEELNRPCDQVGIVICAERVEERAVHLVEIEI